ncbi:hypothetical protein [Nocardiopsis xinjiangensis]|uniref:hypothetical protein n=1 Tax=Nocardiopsis xinjiangensis TaxID=124285 RepID=UPI00034BA41D|nr:hypothetical protein [Nocardiopsis xinjiangensis]
MDGYRVFPSAEVRRLRSEFPHHLICELHDHRGRPVFVAILAQRSCPCPADLVTASTLGALRQALVRAR